MTMQIALSTRTEDLIRQQIAAGKYDDASALIEEALQLLFDQQHFTALQAAIEEGFADPEDEDALLTPELFEDLRKTAHRLVEEGHTPHPDVRP